MFRKKVNSGNIKILISQEETDPICMRVSIGGRSDKGYYLVFRGDKLSDIQEMLTIVHSAFRAVKKKFSSVMVTDVAFEVKDVDNNTLVKVFKERTDPEMLRASIGGLMDKGFYLSFKGDNLDAVDVMLKEVVSAFLTAISNYEIFKN